MQKRVNTAGTPGGMEEVNVLEGTILQWVERGLDLKSSFMTLCKLSSVSEYPDRLTKRQWEYNN